MKPIRPAIKFIQQHLGDNLTGAEIGVWLGKHAQEMFHYISPRKMFLIDPWQKSYEHRLKPSQRKEMVSGRRAFRAARRRLQKYRDRIRFMQLSSFNASRLVKNNSLHFVYIDADHEYEAVNKDIKLWRPKVIKGGVVAGHDFGYNRTPGVTKAVLRYIKNHGLIGHFSPNDWWFINE